MFKLLMTGHTGFVGSRLYSRLTSDGCTVRCASRTHSQSENCVFVGYIGPDTRWEKALSGIDTVVHTAARAHVISEKAANPLEQYRKVNVHGTLNLARQAAQAGVGRFVFISSIKVNGEQTLPAKPFTPDDTPDPEDSYALSKLEAEQGLLHLAHQTGMEVVIIRPPLVYGPGVKGNFARLMRLVEKDVPLPLGAVHNQRSMIGLDNLVDLIVTCIDHPAAVNQVFLGSDGDDLSTTQLLRGIARAMDKPARLIPVPAWLLAWAATMLGKRAVAQRLLGSLQVDMSKTQELLGWEPQVGVDEGLRRAVKGE